MLEMYKLENLFNAVNKIRGLEGLKTVNIKMITTVLTNLEKLLTTYFDKRREISKEFIVTDADGKKSFTDQVALQEKLEVLAKETVEFPTEKINVVYNKTDKWLTVDLNKAFTDVYGDNFNLVEVD